MAVRVCCEIASFAPYETERDAESKRNKLTIHLSSPRDRITLRDVRDELEAQRDGINKKENNASLGSGTNDFQEQFRTIKDFHFRIKKQHPMYVDDKTKHVWEDIVDENQVLKSDSEMIHLKLLPINLESSDIEAGEGLMRHRRYKNTQHGQSRVNPFDVSRFLGPERAPSSGLQRKQVLKPNMTPNSTPASVDERGGVRGKFDLDLDFEHLGNKLKTGGMKLGSFFKSAALKASTRLSETMETAAKASTGAARKRRRLPTEVEREYLQVLKSEIYPSITGALVARCHAALSSKVVSKHSHISDATLRLMIKAAIASSGSLLKLEKSQFLRTEAAWWQLFCFGNEHFFVELIELVVSLMIEGIDIDSLPSSHEEQVSELIRAAKKVMSNLTGVFEEGPKTSKEFFYLAQALGISYA